ncbi:MAG: glycosyltransferase family 4 protein [Acidobacteria bacterium]|nr:glycosyltransferase family 4 protein [Acidobacteriota bacterium]
MRVGLVVFANKWTGAGAVAELTCRALRRADVDAHLLFVGGRNLERRLEGNEWAYPGLSKDRTAAQLAGNIGAIKRLADESDIVISHLPHDHFLCFTAGVHRSVPLVRAFRHPRSLRRDPYHRCLNRRISGAVLAYSALERDLPRVFSGVPVASLPVPLEDRFRPGNGSEWRDRLGIPRHAPVIGSVGKLAAGRGFDLMLDAASMLSNPAHIIIVGHGELRAGLEKQAHHLGLAERISWAGYQNEALPDLYAAMDVVLFCAPGSDWGHRSISEAQGCDRPVVAVSWPGVEDLMHQGINGRIVQPDASLVAEAADSLMADPKAMNASGSPASAVADRRFKQSGERFARFLGKVLSESRERKTSTGDG